MKKNKIVLVGR